VQAGAAHALPRQRSSAVSAQGIDVSEGTVTCTMHEATDQIQGPARAPGARYNGGRVLSCVAPSSRLDRQPSGQELAVGSGFLQAHSRMRPGLTCRPPRRGRRFNARARLPRNPRRIIRRGRAQADLISPCPTLITLSRSRKAQADRDGSISGAEISHCCYTRYCTAPDECVAGWRSQAWWSRGCS
jgi:hypothetical protein